MTTTLDYITIDGEQVYRPPEFMPQMEDILREYTTCTGATIADRVGWKYADMTLKWDALPQGMVDVLIAMTNESTMTFDGLDGELVTENVARVSAVGLRHRYTMGGVTLWKQVEVEIMFLDSHTD